MGITTITDIERPGFYIQQARKRIVRARFCRALLYDAKICTSVDRRSRAKIAISENLRAAQGFLKREEILAGMMFSKHGCTFGLGARNLQGSKWREWTEFVTGLNEFAGIDLPKIKRIVDER